MFNVTVLKMKDIRKYVLGMLITIIAIILISKWIPKIAQEKKALPQILSNHSMIQCFAKTIPNIESANQEKQEINKEATMQSILKTQISSLQGVIQMETDETTQEVAKSENQEEEVKENPQEEIQQAEEGLSTEVITQNPIKENYQTQYGNVKIKNETDYVLTNEILEPNITIENKNIILFHTHSCESYTSSEAYPYTPTGSFRTTDLNYSVTRVGTELENQLKQYNYNVIHDTSYHDYPAYTGSYTRSLATVENILKQTPSDIIIDVHRDAIGSRSDYAPIVKIGENDVAAQIMFVIRH